jgi:hypothetical protein
MTNRHRHRERSSASPAQRYLIARLARDRGVTARTGLTRGEAVREIRRLRSRPAVRR